MADAGIVPDAPLTGCDPRRLACADRLDCTEELSDPQRGATMRA